MSTTTSDHDPGAEGGAGLSIPCCPPLEPDTACTVIDFRYRLVHPTQVALGDRAQTVPVEVILHVRLERCPGPFALGDLVYSTTLLPGEKVRLFTTDRRTRYSFDSETRLSYRNEQTSEEHFYTASMSDFMSDLTVAQRSSATNTSSGSTKGHAETSSLLGSIFGNPSIDVSGSYDASSTSAFLSELHEHAVSSHRRAEVGARASSTVSVGEVSTRAHAQGESEDHYEASSREFTNPNHCHALTFLFYRINKRQTVRMTLESIERRVLDAAAPTKLVNNRFLDAGDIGTVPTAILATTKDRLEVEATGRSSVAAAQASTGLGLEQGSASRATLQTAPIAATPIPEELRAAALQHLDEALVKGQLLDKVGGAVTPGAQALVVFEEESALPTPGIVVKGCLDECDICEREVHRRIHLELERSELDNALLRKQIDLLEKSQEYRCCPSSEPSPPEE